MHTRVEISSMSPPCSVEIHGIINENAIEVASGRETKREKYSYLYARISVYKNEQIRNVSLVILSVVGSVAVISRRKILVGAIGCGIRLLVPVVVNAYVNKFETRSDSNRYTFVCG